MSCRLIHLANFNSTNIGNGALICGTERVIAEDASFPIEWLKLPWDDYTFGLKPFDKAFVEFINSTDGLFVNGAIMMNGRPHFPNSGMRIDLPLNLWEMIRKPIIFHGVSHRWWTGMTYHHLDRLQETLKVLLTMPNVFFGVRNDGTAEWIRDFVGIDSDRIVDVPDPGFFVEPADVNTYPEIKDGFRNFIVSLNDEDASFRYVDDHARICIVESIVRVLEPLLEEGFTQLVLVPHYFDDYRMMTKFVEIMKPRLVHQCVVSSGLCQIPHTRWFYGRYTHADLVISMRVHSMSPAIGMCLPVVPIVTQPRIRFFLNNAGLIDLAADIIKNDFSGLLSHLVRQAVERRELLRSRYKVAFYQLRKQMSEVNKMICRFIERN